MAAKTESSIAYSGICVALIPIFIGLYEYRQNNEREFEKSFLTQQSVVYDELLGDLGSISTSISNPTDSLSQVNYNSAKYKFNQLYYGKLNLYQNPYIEKLTDSLFSMINSYDSARSTSYKLEVERLIEKTQDKV